MATWRSYIDDQLVAGIQIRLATIQRMEKRADLHPREAELRDEYQRDIRDMRREQHRRVMEAAELVYEEAA